MKFEVLAPVCHTDSLLTKVNAGETAVRIVTISDFQRLYNLPTIDTERIFIFATNADGAISDVHVEGTTILNGYIYAVFDRKVEKETQIRINYCLMYF